MEYRYKALQIKQTSSNKVIVLFSAPAVEIDQWAGVPQKKRFGTGEETVGFQREENESRVESLGAFCANDENIIQNPLLCSTRSIRIASARFEANPGEDGDTLEGALIVTTPDYATLSMADILGLVREYLESRVPELKTATLDDGLIARLKALAAKKGQLTAEDGGEATEEEKTETSEPVAEIPEAEGVLFEESHIVDFWQEIACRHEVVKLMEIPPAEDFLGFTKSALRLRDKR